MGKKWTKIAAVLGIIICLAIIGMLTKTCLDLVKTRDDLREEVVDLENRQKIIYKKYKNEKIKATGLLRSKMALESKIREKQKSIDDLIEEKVHLEKRKKAKVGDLRKEVDVLRKEVEKKELRGNRLQADLSQCKGKSETIATDLEKTRKEKESLEVEKMNLISELKDSKNLSERYRRNNQDLTEIAKDLIEKYKSKTIADVMAEKEPLTQIGKIELEKFVQEYGEKIDKEIIKPNDG